jgi:hypothetical protein
MVDKMRIGDCPNVTNSLVVTVNHAFVSVLSLASEGLPNNLKTVKFTKEAVPLELLAGIHCVFAAQATLGILRKGLKVLWIREKKVNRADPNSETAVEVTKVAIEVVGVVVKLSKT